MNKTELVTSLAKKSKLSLKDSKQYLDDLLDVVTKTLKKGDSIQIMGFGKFEVKYRKPRKTYNPITQKMMSLKASCTPTFKAGKALKTACKG